MSRPYCHIIGLYYSGVISTTEQLDYEQITQHNLSVEVTDGVYVSITIYGITLMQHTSASLLLDGKYNQFSTIIISDTVLNFPPSSLLNIIYSEFQQVF